MKIEAHIENPIIHNSDDFCELERKVNETDPTVDSLLILTKKVVIERIARRSFRFSANPSMDWIISKVKFMKEHNL